MSASFDKPRKYVYTVRCTHCGQALARSEPLTREDTWDPAITPCGCTSDAETRIEEVPVSCP